MSRNTPIQWCDDTANPTMGCSGCELWGERVDEVTGQRLAVRKCYAGVQHQQFGGVRRGYSPTFEQVTFWPGRTQAVAGQADLRGRRRILPYNSVNQVYKHFTCLPVDRSHHTEINQTDNIFRENEDIAGMRVSMKKTMVKNLF